MQYLAIAAVGLAAGAINAAAGSGSLLTFPVLLGLGYSPLVANVSNSVGLTFGNLSASFGYRRELEGQRSRLLRLAPFSLVGGAVGAVLLLALPHQVFRVVVPGLVILAVVLLLLQPRLAKVRSSREANGGDSGPVGRGPGLPAAVLGTAVYGGYFGAAQGVILIAALGVFLDDTLQRLNGLKNILTSMANGAAAVVFIFRAPVAWDAALVLAGASIVGGQLGAGVGRRLPPTVLRWVVIVGGAAAAIKLLV
ncbi:MAG: sulfite exporter TauE/SafE family protein [Candidatus Dormiibacterota bacterium]